MFAFKSKLNKILQAVKKALLISRRRKKTKAILGFRKWDVDVYNQKLRSCTKYSVWRPGVNIAECYRYNHHLAPAPGCHCGFNAWYSLKKANKNYQGIVGAIAGAGRVELHYDGFRSSEAQIIALLLPPKTTISSKLVEKLADNYNLQVFENKKDFTRFVKSKTRQIRLRRFKLLTKGGVRRGRKNSLALHGFNPVFILMCLTPLILSFTLVIFSEKAKNSDPYFDPGALALVQEQYYTNNGSYPNIDVLKEENKNYDLEKAAQGLEAKFDYKPGKDNQSYQLTVYNDSWAYGIQGKPGQVQVSCQGVLPDDNKCSEELKLTNPSIIEQTKTNYKKMTGEELASIELSPKEKVEKELASSGNTNTNVSVCKDNGFKEIAKNTYSIEICS